MLHVVFHKKWFALIAGVLLVMSSLSACGTSANNGGGNTSTTGTPIKIGFATSLTGDFSSDGKLLLDGYKYWAKTVNDKGGLMGRKVVLDWLDDQSNLTVVPTVYQTLIRDHRDDLIFGPFGFSNAPAGKVADRFGYVMLNGSGTTPESFDQGIKNIFSVSLSTQHYFKSFADYILSIPAKDRPKTAAYALLNADDTFGHPPVQEAKQLLEQGGVKTVAYKEYPDETVDFQPIGVAIAQSHADVVLLGSESPDTMAKYVKIFKQQHYNPKAIIGLSGPDAGDQFTSLIDGVKSAEGIFVPNDGWWPTAKTYQNDVFVKGYVAANGGKADDISSDTVQAFATGQVLEQAVAKVNSIDNAKLHAALSDVNNTWNSIQGPVQFSATGENKASVAYLFQWQDGQMIPVYPSNQAVKNPQYPKNPWP